MPSRARLLRFRLQAFHHQDGRCYYCDHAMWLDDPGVFAARFGLSRRQALLFQATAEHLLAQQDGGKDEAQNVVAACRFCNAHRHRAKVALDPVRYRAFVSRRMARGRWFHGNGPKEAASAPRVERP